MTDSTRATIWYILSRAFGMVLRTVQATVPSVRMAAGHSRNEAFLFRAYAQYSAGGVVVDISFDVQVKDRHVHTVGDIAWEDGLIIRSLMDRVVDREFCDEQLLVTHASCFASECENHANLIANALNEGRDRSAR